MMRAKPPSSISPMHFYLQHNSTKNALFAAVEQLQQAAASLPHFRMDYITSFDIRLEKDVYYAGEPVIGCVVLENSDPIKIRGGFCWS